MPRGGRFNEQARWVRCHVGRCGRFVHGLESRLPRDSDGEATVPLRVVVVGAGAAGIEVAFTLRARLLETGRSAEIAIVSDSEEVLPRHPDRVASAARRELARRGLAWRVGRVVAVEKDRVRLEDGTMP